MEKTEDNIRKARSRDEAPVRNVAVVVLGPVGRPLTCDAHDLRLAQGDHVIVEDRRGGAFGKVVVESARRPMHGPVARILRKATPADEKAHAEEALHAGRALAYARERSRALKLDIKLFQVDLSPRRDRATVYFASEQRIDFRELLRDLGAHLRARVELRQVGVRDEAKLVGGIGSCGRELCCSTFLPKFEPISIRMAKNQNLALTPSKISGQCGRLKCCLVYEEAQYIEAAKGLPKIGKAVETPEGVGRVQDLDILRGRIRVFFPDRPPQVFSPDQVQAAAAPPRSGEPAERREAHAREGSPAANAETRRPNRERRRQDAPRAHGAAAPPGPEDAEAAPTSDEPPPPDPKL